MKNSRICTKCSGYIDYSNPKEPFCVNCGMRLAWDSSITRLTSSSISSIVDPTFINTSEYSAGLALAKRRVGLLKA